MYRIHNNYNTTNGLEHELDVCIGINVYVDGVVLNHFGESSLRVQTFRLRVGFCVNSKRKFAKERRLGKQKYTVHVRTDHKHKINSKEKELHKIKDTNPKSPRNVATNTLFNPLVVTLEWKP